MLASLTFKCYIYNNMSVPESFYVGVGAAIKAARINAGITQEQLALAVNLKRTSISNIEKGRQKLLLDGFYKIAFALHITSTALLENALKIAENRQSQNLVTISHHGLDDLSHEERQIIEKSLKLSTGGSGDAK